MGFTDVRTALSSGNVIFSGRKRQEPGLIKTIEAGMARDLPRSFRVFIRTTEHLQAMLAADPFSGHRLAPKAKRIVTFLDRPAQNVALPIERDGARILTTVDREVFSAYVPNERSPAFMTLIEKTFSKDVTTRTWATVGKCAVL